MTARSALHLLCCVVGGIATAASPAAFSATAPAAGGAPAAAAAALAIERCLTRLDPELDVGRERIAHRCPGLLEAIAASPLAPNLPGDWQRSRNELSAGGLRALRRALRATPAAPSRRSSPDVAALAPLVARARIDAGAGSGPWSRFTRWLRAAVERSSTPRAERGAIAEWLRDLRVPARAWATLGYLALAALVAFIGWVAWGELRAAGLVGRAAARAVRTAPDASRRAGEDAAFESLDWQERPAWLLRRLAAVLQARGGLAAAAALTNRELVQRAHLERPGDRESLRAIAGAAERVRFASRPPPAVELEPAIAAAHALLAELEARARGGAR